MMPKGEYYIGDLCYVMNDVWDEVCENLEEGEHTLSDGRKYALYFTAYGDGMYSSNIGTNHPVDAGLIGCIKMDDIGGFQSNFGACVMFENDFDTNGDMGVMSFGRVVINTRDDAEDCEDYDEGFDYDE